MSLWDTIFGGKRARRMARYRRKVAAINELETSLRRLSDAALQARSQILREHVRDGTTLDALQVEAYALVREAARRTLGLRHYDVQLLGGMVLHAGMIAEMRTGEGKTLVATLAAFLNALSGQGVHIVTVNDYLAQRDAEWMGPLCRFLGLTVGVILEEMGADEDEEHRSRRAAYACDITYGTNHEIAFDYLRDNLATDPQEIVHRGFHYAIVDEVDCLLVDEARTPLIISGPAREDPGHFRRVDRIVRPLREGLHFVVDPKTHTASLNEVGFEAVEKGLKVRNLCDPEHLELLHAVHQLVLAHGVYKRDVDYIVEDDEVLIVDEFTGRVSEDKRYANGLHQAIEAKEQVAVKAEERTLAKVTYQSFFGRYDKLAGMTGTAWSERQEFMHTYGRDVQVIPTHRPVIRRDYPNGVFRTLADKHEAVVEEILDRRAAGQPVLVGTTSVRESEELSRWLEDADVPHSLLNAKNHRAEATIIAQAGRKGAVTISTNMAGRGTDIVLGGNPEMMAKGDCRGPGTLDKLRHECAQEQKEVVAAGGLHVIGTACHESVRIDNQLRGRAGRQGDPGSSEFIVSLDDELWKKFGRAQIDAIRADLDRQRHPEAKPIDSPKVRRILRSLQNKVDDENRAIRCDVLKYDLVVHTQRESIYAWRQSLVTGEGYDPVEIIRDVVDDLIARSSDRESLVAALRAHFHEPFDLHGELPRDLTSEAINRALALLAKREKAVGSENLHEMGRLILLEAVDDLWTEHLSNLEHVEEGIGLHDDPLLEWKKVSAGMWHETLRLIRSRAVTLWFLVDARDCRQ
jgi:preprotein translocase subunit SecA